MEEMDIADVFKTWSTLAGSWDLSQSKRRNILIYDDVNVTWCSGLLPVQEHAKEDTPISIKVALGFVIMKRNIQCNALLE